NAYSYPECISQPVIDSKMITLGETGGIVSLDLSKSPDDRQMKIVFSASRLFASRLSNRYTFRNTEVRFCEISQCSNSF
ncbi:MAG TPA: hypothetical protein VH796_09145, partial [Nitrososphaeraceae archaeon]